MDRRTTPLALAAAAALGLFTACSDGGTEPQGLDEIALMMLADQAMSDADEDVEHVRAPGIPGLRFPARIPGLGTGDAPDCPQEGGTYVCTFEGRSGLESTVRITFLDAAGGIQDAYDEELTASVELSSSAEGSLEGGRFTGSISRSRDMTVSGLLGPETERIWNGTSEGSSTRM